MSIESTRYAIQAWILKEERQYHGGYSHTKRGSYAINLRSNNFLTNNISGRNKKRRISPIYEDIGAREKERSVILQRTADCEKPEKETENPSTLPRRWKSRISWNQRNHQTDHGDSILGLTTKRYCWIHKKLSDLSKRRENEKKETERSDWKTGQDIESSIHLSHNKIIKDQEKGLNLDNPEPVFRNDTSQGYKRTGKSWTDMTELLWNRLKATWISPGNQNRSENRIHV